MISFSFSLNFYFILVSFFESPRECWRYDDLMKKKKPSLKINRFDQHEHSKF